MAREVTGRADLRSEADRLGIETAYVDAHGRRRSVAARTIQKIAAALRDGAIPVVLPEITEDAAPGAPSQACQGPPGRHWMLAAQLYAVRSRRNWGYGDFTDLLALIELAADIGAAGVGINPLHALFDEAPQRPSPYSPNSRLFLNPLYIDLDAVADFDGARTAEVAAEAERLRHTALVDHVGVAALKARSLRAAHRAFRRDASAERREDFASFRQSRHPVLARFAAFEVLRHRFPQPWWEWPIEWREPDETALARLRDEAAEDIEHVEYVQWLADRQLMRCRDRARSRGLPIGLYLDVAVGVQPTGFDAWQAPDAVARTLAVGAPPDLLNTLGQNWGLAGFSGVGLRGTGFRAFRDMLRAAMRYAGAIRIDHAFGLKRLYVIPQGMRPDQGAYLRMPFAQMLEVVADESAANQCIVIGEDLGTVPAGFREEVARHGIWSYQVMLFERDGRGAFFSPAHYAERALVTFATHDLPTFAGWRSGHDLALRAALAIPAGESEEERAAAIRALRAALRAQGLTALDFPSIVRFLAASPAKLLAVALEDALGEREQVNVPGTIDTHPNWRRKLPRDIESLRADAGLRELARIAAESGRAAGAPARGRHG
ncbi:MAG TPA: 4-alpha-glucanotransferase [Xanthobacteraceae bacterium]